MAINQKPDEEKQVARIGRRGLETAVEKMTPEIMAIAAPSVRSAGSTWLKRAIVSIANDDKLRDVLQSEAGIFSVIKGFEKAATMGLQLGGQFPQAYMTGFDGKAELIVSAEGFKHTAIHGPGAVLSDMLIRRVYEGENFAVDFAGNTVAHSYDGKTERGKVIGVYCIMTRTDGVKIIDYMTRSEALRVRDGHSKAWRAFQAKKVSSCPWNTDEDAMIEKTAAKKFLRKFAAEAEGLAMLFGQDADDFDDQSTTTPEPAPRDVSDRMADHLDRRTERTAAAPVVPQADTVEAEVVADTEPVQESKPVELF